MLRLLTAGIVFLVGLLTWRLASPVLVNQKFTNQIFKTENAAPDSPATEARNIGFDTEVPATPGARPGTAATGQTGAVRAVGANSLPANPSATDPVLYPEVANTPAPSNAPVKGVW